MYARLSMTHIPLLRPHAWLPPQAALRAYAAAPWMAFLDSGGAPDAPRARWSFLCPRPRETLVWRGKQLWRNDMPVGGSVWEHLRDMRLALPLPPKGPPPFRGGLIGLASYGAGLALENVVSRHHSTTPDLIAFSCTDLLAFDRQEQRCFAIGDLPAATSLPSPATFSPLTFTPDMDRADWLVRVQKVIDLIGAGDIFQANLTMRWHAHAPSSFDEHAAYEALRAASPAPFGAWFRTPEVSLLSASVERFLSLSTDGIVETRPIKGTAPFGADDTETRHLAAALTADTKENAENLMITDLMRNDIGRVCEIGSISVPQLCKVERFAHLHHLVSCVQGRLRPGLTAEDLLRATLPPGSVTGAPKHRAMEIIDAVETSARGAYCGTLFRIGREGEMDSSVVIRSMERTGDRLAIGAGGGITWPSDPAREYDEMLLKAAPLLKVFAQ